jgi:hypothetical protein
VTGSAPTGSVTFFTGSTPLGTGNLNGSNQASLTTTIQGVEYGNGLNGWTQIAIPQDTAGVVTITPGALSDHVKVSIPPQGGSGFARLNPRSEVER